MAYATATQVAQEAKVNTGFTTETMPTSAKVAEIIAETDAFINAQVGLKYIVPLTDASDLLLIRNVALALCVERVREIMQVSANGPQGDQTGRPKSAADRARDFLKSVVKGEILLSALPATTGQGFASYSGTNDVCPIMQKDKDQW